MNRLYEKTNKLGEKAFFAAANSGYGFFSFYDEVFANREIVKRYIIKGGPGTGKSRFMREAAIKASSLGYDVEYYYCSSDPTSLDGIIIDCGNRGRISVIDGTPPHAAEPTLPGVRDEIVNLGDFWHSDRLLMQKERIESLMKEKSEAYSRLYECLNASFKISETRERISHMAIKKEKLDASSLRLLSRIDACEDYYERIGLRSAFGMFGEFCNDTYSYLADDIIIVDDSLMLADSFLSSVFAHLKKLGISSYRSYSFFNPKKLDAIYIPSASLSFISDAFGICTSNEKCRKKINMQRFIDFDILKEVKNDIKSCEKIQKELKIRAENEAEKIRQAHFSLEEIYIREMDFCEKEDFSSKWLEENL